MLLRSLLAHMNIVILDVTRCPQPMMGGLTGLPRIPPQALQATRSFNPGGEYKETIATLWRDLETLYGNEEVAGLGGSRTYRDSARLVDTGVKTGKFRGFTYDEDMRVKTVLNAVKQVPSLLNPDVSNRFVFAKSKAILVGKLGSQSAAIDAMKQDPTLLQDADALEDMSAGMIKVRAMQTAVKKQLAPLVIVLAVCVYAATSAGVPDLAAVLPSPQGMSGI